MKKLFYIISILGISFLQAQNNWTYTGPNGGSWHDPANWDTGTIPSSEINENITIPAGKTVHILSGNTFDASWTFITGSGTINNYGKITKPLRCEGCSYFEIRGVQIHNYGEINSYWIGGGSWTLTSWFIVRNGATIINEVGGVMNLGINLTSDDDPEAIHLINKGTLRLTMNQPTPDGDDSYGYLDLGIINDGGTIEMVPGAKYQVGSTYQYHRHINPVFNLAEGAELTYQARSYWEGNLNGHNEGVFDFMYNTKYVEDGKTAVNNITGNGIQMGFGSIEGPGTFVNNTKFTLLGGTGSKQIRMITIENNGEFIIDETGAHTNMRLIDSEFNNNPDGEFLIYGQLGMGSVGSTFNNYGAIRKYNAEGAIIEFNIYNYGLIENHTAGLFTLANASELVNHETGIIKGYSFLFSGQPNLFLNNGRVAPGIDGVGTMEARSTYDGFDQGETGVLEVNLNSLTEYDVVEGFFGNSSKLEGGLDILLGFAPEPNDEFTIITSNRTIDLSLAQPISATYDGVAYIFEAELANGDKDLKLKVKEFTEIPDGAFEERLVNIGLDDMMDGKVETANITDVSDLDVSNRNISDLAGIEDFVSLVSLNCSGNELASLDFGDFMGAKNGNDESGFSLEYLNCSDNQITSLDVSGLTALTTLLANDNALTVLDVKNGNNINFNAFNSTGNPNLTCIQVDDANWSATNWTSIDSWTSFNEDCGFMDVTDNQLSRSQLEIYPNPVKDVMNFSRSIDGALFDITGKKVLSIKNADSVNLSTLAKGIYILVTSEGISKKIILR